MTTRREVLGLFGSLSLGTFLLRRNAFLQGDSAPALAPGAPNSPERLALVQEFRKQAEGIDQAFEARTSQQREELLLERPVQGSHRRHSALNTPTTLPRIWTWRA